MSVKWPRGVYCDKEMMADYHHTHPLAGYSFILKKDKHAQLCSRTLQFHNKNQYRIEWVSKTKDWSIFFRYKDNDIPMVALENVSDAHHKILNGDWILCGNGLEKISIFMCLLGKT